MEWQITDTDVRKRVMLLVSREDHCLADLLYRWRSGDMECDITSVVSNHEDLRSFVEWHEHPFPRGPGAGRGRRRRQRRSKRSSASSDRNAPTSWCWPGTCRFFRAFLCTALSGRIINIHHSFLPVLRRIAALPSGLRAWRQADRRHVSLRDGRPRRGTHHRAGHPPDRPRGQPRRVAAGRPGHRAHRAGPGPALAPGGPCAPQRIENRRLRIENRRLLRADPGDQAGDESRSAATSRRRITGRTDDARQNFVAMRHTGKHDLIRTGGERDPASQHGMEEARVHAV